MIANLEYLNVPTAIIVAVMIFIVVSNVVGELLKLKGILAPEFMRIRDWRKRKKQERETMRQVPQMLENVQRTLDEFNSYYSADNIGKRNHWMENVNCKLKQDDALIQELEKKLDKNNEITLSLLIDHKRNTIIGFSSKVIDPQCPVTREEFNRVFKIYAEYENIIEENGLVNGEVDIAIRIIQEAYEEHLRNHSFVEDIRGYNM